LFAGRPISRWAELFSAPVLEHHWRFGKEEPDGHGPFYALLSLVGYTTIGRWLDPPLSFRIGSVILFSIAVAAVYVTMRQRCGLAPALVTAALLASVPRLVPEVCFALIDGPLVSLALLAWCCFLAAGRSTVVAAAFGCCLGLAMATKLTGWLLPIPYIVWTTGRWLLDHWGSHGQRLKELPKECEVDRTETMDAIVSGDRAMRTLLIGGATALLVALVVNVGWWPDPVNGIKRFFASNLTRAQTIPIGIQFLGTRYAFALPWYNTLVWTVVAMPVGTLLLGLWGLVTTVRCRDAFGWLVVGNWLLLLVIRALPQAPGHDGTRQLAVSFAFLAVLAGYGFADLCGRWGLHLQQSLDSAGRAAGALRAWQSVAALLVGAVAVGESLAGVIRYHPLQLSYYSPLVGGLAGATRLGFEPTYFWDALTPEVLDWINANTAADRYVLFRNNPTSWNYLAAWGKLRARHQGPQLLQRAQWAVLQHRPGIYLPSDDWLIEHGTPAFRKSLCGVPLISIYPIEQFLDAQRRK
jgi:hypothetical protein